MKLYDTERAPNPRRTRIYLAEKGLSVPRQPVDLGGLEHLSDEFGAINPFRLVPVLELDDGTRISESMAICRYFEELHPAPPLFGTGALERSLVEMWCRRIDMILLVAVAQVFRHTSPGMAKREKPQIAEWAEVNRGRVARFLAALEGELGERPFIAGERFTMGDICGLVALDFMRAARLSVPDELVRVRRWHAALAARPSAAA
jgi:glutathione S-transferase